MGLFGRAKKKDKSSNKRAYPLGKSCFDCKHCDTRSLKDEKIFCKWDSEYYYPETGSDCIDFNK